MSTGYSGTPLARKLGLKPGMRAWFDAMPDSVYDEIHSVEPNIAIDPDNLDGLDAVHVFVIARSDLERSLAMWRKQIVSDGFIWVSWPKKASKVPTDITEDTIREVALPIGLVDVKVCAVDAVWSGLKLVIRKELR
ncbi:DUF3052 family protein [Sphingomonas sp.]|uniref:DUF3052 family protein n=1 Tax=Sphingomonas sp. TaxID=28214 RepID=UPI002DD665B5|nr:DUF3052 family protein [Sphingomonas sp.]